MEPIEKNEHLVWPIALRLVLCIMNTVRGSGQMPIRYSVDYGLLMSKPRKAVFANEKRMKKNLYRSLHMPTFLGQVRAAEWAIHH